MEVELQSKRKNTVGLENRRIFFKRLDTDNDKKDLFMLDRRKKEERRMKKMRNSTFTVTAGLNRWIIKEGLKTKRK